MSKAIFIFISFLFLIACKKENPAVVHSVQFSSNVTDSQYYTLTINGSAPNDISSTYNVQPNSDVQLQLKSAGGDTTSIDSRDSLWVRGGIIVDGQSVRSFTGYHDITLSYHID
jgi:hypothetical protein